MPRAVPRLASDLRIAHLHWGQNCLAQSHWRYRPHVGDWCRYTSCAYFPPTEYASRPYKIFQSLSSAQGRYCTIPNTTIPVSKRGCCVGVQHAHAMAPPSHPPPKREKGFQFNFIKGVVVLSCRELRKLKIPTGTIINDIHHVCHRGLQEGEGVPLWCFHLPPPPREEAGRTTSLVLLQYL